MLSAVTKGYGDTVSVPLSGLTSVNEKAYNNYLEIENQVSVPLSGLTSVNSEILAIAK